MKTHRLISLLSLSCAIALLCACQPQKKESNEEESVEIAKNANDSTFSDRKEEKDADFIVNAVAASYGEIKLSQLAHNKSVSDHVKEMAKQLEQDHTKILNELKAYADQKGIATPLEEASEDSNELSNLDNESVDKFDKQWGKAMTKRHRKSIDRFEGRLNKTDDAELKAWISTNLPTLKSHLEMLDAEPLK